MDYPSFVCTSLGDPGGSAYYRIILPLLFSDAAGHIQLRMPNQFHFYPIEYLKNLKPDTIVFHRSHTDPQRKYIKDLSNHIDLLKVYTIDDWVGKVPKESPHFKSVSPTADKEIKKAIGLCDRLIVTNEYLANVYGYKKETIVIPNYLPSTTWKNLYLTNPRKYDLNPDRQIRIGWSGGMGHPGDLKILKEIADLLGDKIRWVFLGDIPPGFDQGNSEVHNPVSPTEYAKKLYSLNLDLALAPLLDNEFNRAKSNLRILEYGACGYPVIASNVLPYKNAPVTLLEHNATWWANEITSKIGDLESLQKDAETLKDWVWENYKLEDHLQEYADVLSPDGIGFKPTKPEIEESNTIDVVITTHNHLDVVKECIDSVIESIPLNKTRIEIIVSDNASDESGMREYLDTLHAHPLVEVLESDKDYGYINNVNKGLKFHLNRDAIMLNSDTIVNGDWVDRLKNLAYKNEQIASVTPFTNNGTICSYPNPATSETERGLVKFYDGLCSDLTFVDEPLELPTPVGFCTFLKRAAIADVGLFDPHAFGRGYGDENEWSLRSRKRMWKHVLGHDVYVGHSGSATFGQEKQKLMEEAGKVLVTRWQQYSQMIQQFMQNNPINNIRQQLDILSLTKSSIKDRVLYIAHGFGGGLETYLQKQLESNEGAIVIRNDLERIGLAKIEVVGDQYFNLPLLNMRLSSLEFLKKFFEGAKVKKISVQTTFGYDYNMPAWISNLAKLMNIPYEVMLHDYWTVCPRLRMFQSDHFCGAPTDIETCDKCVMAYGSGLGQVSVGYWREMYNGFLYEASRVMAPSHDLADRINKYFPQVYIDVIQHEDKPNIGEFDGYKKWDGKEELRIAVIGNISPDKGSLLVRDCAQYCADNKLPVKFVVFGSLIDNSAILKMIPPSQNLTILGNYEEQDIKTLLNLNGCHISFFSALWPETWSYTLSHAFKAGLYPVAFDIGAIAERIRETGFGKVIPYELHSDPSKVVESLVNTARELVKENELSAVA